MSETRTALDAIVQEIEIHGPAERIFAALTDPEQLVKWWGVEGQFQTTQMESDLRPGGKWTMRGTGRGGAPFTVTGEYRQIERPTLLVMTWTLLGGEDASETLVRFDIDESGGATRVRVTHTGFATESQRQRYSGWPLLLKLLNTYVTQR